MQQIEAVSSAKPLRPSLDFYVQAWFDLDTTRELGFAVGPISWLAMIKYAETYELKPWHREIFVGHIKAMDMAYRSYLAEKAKIDSNNKTRK